ncbi:hypothetical protein BD626DRAFT_484023 [Schizophyllum amplum]|uniref:EthD domain-containing protein n=1 Tax=Schizophyllum amplum TaxID=97359 RepID=A0A550CPZ6_9AGAR|nr:hypothetical protein BD626DRAFT_484023 [Auriculariopsis ampla]
MTEITKPLPLVVILQEVGLEIDQDRYLDWYNNEHGPRRLTIDGFLNAARWEAVDGKKPSWLTLYDLTSEDVANGDAYQAVAAMGSDNEKEILQKLEASARVVYRYLSSRTHPSATQEQLPGKYVLAVWMDVKPEREEEFNKWYNEEHLALLEKVPGWLRGRRYTLVGAKARGAAPEAQLKYLAVHELSHDGFMESAELKEAMSTPWREDVMKDVTNKIMRSFKLNVVYEKPGK